LHTQFGTSEFEAEYQAAIAGKPRQAKGALQLGTLAWLIARYRETADWQNLAQSSRKVRERFLLQVIETAGARPYAKVDTAAILAGRDRRAHTPAQARVFLDVMRGLFRWALNARLVKSDPTAGVANPPRKRGSEGYIAWTEDDMAAYERRWPIGTRQRVWLDVIAYTGLRKGDAVRLGRQHVRDGVASLKTEKSGFRVPVMLPILPQLAATLDAGPCGDLTFIVGESGHPLTKEGFGNLFRAACKAAGVPGSAHGVRKIAATRAANAGATVAQLEAIFGWSGGGMAALYTRSADRRRLAAEAMHKLGTSIPAPADQVRAPEQKPKRDQ
jgi:integrase